MQTRGALVGALLVFGGSVWGQTPPDPSLCAAPVTSGSGNSGRVALINVFTITSDWTLCSNYGGTYQYGGIDGMDPADCRIPVVLCKNSWIKFKAQSGIQSGQVESQGNRT